MEYSNVSMDPKVRECHAVILAKFDQGLGNGPGGLNGDTKAFMELVEETSFDAQTGLFAIVSQEPQFQKRKGSFVSVFRPDSYAVESKPEPASMIMEITDRELRTDKWGLIAKSAENIGLKVAQRKGVFSRANLRVGLTAKGPGGNVFWSTTQWVNPTAGASGGTYANKFALALTHDNYSVVYAAMQNTTYEDGETKRGVKPTHLIVSANLRAMGKSIIMGEHLFGGGFNANYDPTMKLVVVPELQDDEWVLASNEGTLMPFGYGFTLAPQAVYVGAKINDAYRNDHIWRADVEDALVFLAPYKAFYSKP